MTSQILRQQFISHYAKPNSNSFFLSRGFGNGRQEGAILNQHTRNRRASQSRNDARDQCRKRNLGDSTTSAGSKLGEHTDLNTDGADVAETANGVGGDETGATGEGSVIFTHESSELERISKCVI